MHLQILQTWPRERQALAIRVHNMLQNNRKRFFFSQNWFDNDAKKRFQRYFLFAPVEDEMTKTGTADLVKCASKIYF